MTKTVEFRFSPESVRLFNRLSVAFDPALVRGRVRGFFGERAQRIAASIVREMLSGRGVGALRRRTGGLAQSIVGRGEFIAGAPALRVGALRGPALRYAAVHEFGTSGRNPQSPYPTIRPRRAKALAQPVGEALTPAGVARYASPRQFPEPLRFVPARRRSGPVIGYLVRAAARGKIQQSDVLWILRRWTDLTPRFYLRDGFNKHFPALRRDLEALLAALLRDGVSGRGFTA